MRGPTPKPPHMRIRGPRAATRATLPPESATAQARVPSLPRRRRGSGPWHARVKAWWNAVWRSPMATEFLESDRPRMLLIAELHQQFWTSPTAGLASEIRLQEQAFGLSPVDRRRLQWTVERAESAAARTTTRRRGEAAAGTDPRAVLRVVSSENPKR